MAKRKLLTLLAITVLLLVLSLSITSAIVTVNYEVRKGIIENNGNLNETNTPVTGVNVEAYVCQDSQCNSVESSPYYNYSSNNGLIKVEYPTNPHGEGYAFYAYKEGYIGWQQIKITYSGEGEKTENFPIYMSKKRTGFAPLNNFSVYNKIRRNMPLQVNVSVGIDAETSAAISDDRLTDEISLRESVNTNVFLEIFDNGNMIHSESKNLNLNYSENRDLSFIYPGFSETGKYKIKLRTEVPDEKISNPISISNSYDLKVISEGLNNYSYSLLQNTIYFPEFPNVGNNIDISFDYLSNYINEFGEISSEEINTSLDVEITANGSNYKNFNLILPWNNGDFNRESFDFMANVSGLYVVNMTASPTNPLGNQSMPQSTSISFFVFENESDEEDNETNETDTIVPSITIHSPTEGQTYSSRTQLVNISADDENLDSIWYNWNGTNITYSNPIEINFSEGSNTLIVWANDTSGNVNSKSITFTIDLDDDDDDDDDDDEEEDNGTVTGGSIGHRIIGSGAVCGNNICELDLGEDEFNCALDCSPGLIFLNLEDEVEEDKESLGIITWSFIILTSFLIILISLLIILQLRE